MCYTLRMTDDEWADLEKRVTERDYEFFGATRDRGHLIVDVTGDENFMSQDLYADDLTPYAIGSRPCPKCHAQHLSDEEPDRCWGWLDGVRFGCCGHGVEEPYVMLMDGTVLRGDEVGRLLGLR